MLQILVQSKPPPPTPFAPIPDLLIAFLLAISKNAVFWFHLSHKQAQSTIHLTNIQLKQ
jgi:hypothetical protein